MPKQVRRAPATYMAERRFTEVCELHLGLPDYFAGYPYPVLAIAVGDRMTLHELAVAIKEEVNAFYDYLSEGFTDNEIDMFGEEAARLLAEPDGIFFEAEEPMDDEDSMFYEGSYLYLSLCKPVFRYGINFLNE